MWKLKVSHLWRDLSYKMGDTTQTFFWRLAPENGSRVYKLLPTPLVTTRVSRNVQFCTNCTVLTAHLCNCNLRQSDITGLFLFKFYMSPLRLVRKQIGRSVSLRSRPTIRPWRELLRLLTGMCLARTSRKWEIRCEAINGRQIGRCKLRLREAVTFKSQVQRALTITMLDDISLISDP